MRLLIYILALGLAFAQPRPVHAQTDPWAAAAQMMASGQTEAAVPLLEQLVSDNPSDKNYRFELAVALFRLGRDFRAKWHLDQVRGADLTPQEAQLVARYLAEIAARSVWSGSFSIALKPETNATRKTSDETISLGGLDFELNPDSKAKPGTSVVTTASLGYSPRLTERVKANFALLTHLRYNKDKALRDYQVIGRAGLQYFPTARTSIAGGVQQGYRWVADSRYSNSTGIWAQHTRLVGARGRLDFALDLSNTSYDVNLPDSQRSFVTASYSHAVTGNAQIGISGFFENTQGSRPNLVGQRASLSLSGLYAWDGGLMTSLRLTHLTDTRDGPEPIFGVTREDESTTLELNIYHRSFRIKSFAPTLALGVEKNRSNIPLARYDNRYVSIGLTRDF